MTLPLRGMRGSGEGGTETPVGAGSKVTAAARLDVCTDGTSHTGAQEWEWTLDVTLVGDGGAVAGKLGGTIKSSRAVEDLKAK